MRAKVCPPPLSSMQACLAATAHSPGACNIFSMISSHSAILKSEMNGDEQSYLSQSRDNNNDNYVNLSEMPIFSDEWLQTVHVRNLVSLQFPVVKETSKPRRVLKKRETDDNKAFTVVPNALSIQDALNLNSDFIEFRGIGVLSRRQIILIANLHLAQNIASSARDFENWFVTSSSLLSDFLPSFFCQQFGNIHDTMDSLFKTLFDRTVRDPVLKIPCKFSKTAFLPSLDDIFSAMKGVYMTDIFLSSALYLMCEPFLDRVLVADALFFSNLEDFGAEKQMQGVLKYYMESTELLMVPVNRGRIHWSLICVFFKEKKVIHFDGLGYHKKIFTKKEKTIICNWMRPFFPDIDRFTFKGDFLIQQTDGHSCGHLLLMTAASLLGLKIFDHSLYESEIPEDSGDYDASLDTSLGILNMVRFMNIASVLFGKSLYHCFLNTENRKHTTKGETEVEGDPCFKPECDVQPEYHYSNCGNLRECDEKEESDEEISLSSDKHAEANIMSDLKKHCVQPNIQTSPKEDESQTPYFPRMDEEFDDVKQAESVLTAFAQSHGFTIRIGRHEIDRITFECSSARKPTRVPAKKTQKAKKDSKRTSAKVNCEWHINLRYRPNHKFKPNCVQITKLVMTHTNHTLIDPALVKYTPQLRKLDDEAQKHIIALHAANAPVAVTRRFLRNAYPKKVFMSSDIHNFISRLKRRRKDSPSQSDAAQLICLLSKKHAECGYFFRFQVDVDNRLMSIYWSSPEQILLARRFSDVIICDNTYKTNRWNMPLTLFCIIDNFNRTRIAGMGLVSDESEDSYRWILQMHKESNGVAPSVVFTDADVALDAAISKVFPESLHLWCIWHMHVNIAKQTAMILGDRFQDFKSDFDKCRCSVTVDSFKESFDLLCRSYPSVFSYVSGYLGAHSDRWAKCYQYFVFTCCIETSSRNESQNFVVKFFLNGRSALVDVFHELEQRSIDQLENNNLDAYLSSRPQNFEGVFAHANMLLVCNVSRHVMDKTIEEQEKSLFCTTPRLVLKEAMIDGKFISLLDSIQFSKAHIFQLSNVKQPTSKRYIAFHDSFFVCSCGESITQGFPCRHFWKCFMSSNDLDIFIGFSMQLINERWLINRDSVHEGFTKAASMINQYDLPLKNASWKKFLSPKPPLPDRILDISRDDKIAQDLRVWSRKVLSHVMTTNREEEFLKVLKDFYNSTLQKAQEAELVINDPVISKRKGRKKKNEKPSQLAMSWRVNQKKQKEKVQSGRGQKRKKNDDDNNEDGEKK